MGVVTPSARWAVIHTLCASGDPHLLGPGRTEVTQLTGRMHAAAETGCPVPPGPLGLLFRRLSSPGSLWQLHYQAVFEPLAVISSSWKHTSLLFCYLMSPKLDQMPWCVLISTFQKAWHPRTNSIALWARADSTLARPITAAHGTPDVNVHSPSACGSFFSVILTN